MSEHLLHQILEELREVKGEVKQNTIRMDSLENRMGSLETKVDSLDKELKEFREETRAELQMLAGGQKGIRAEINDRFTEIKRELNRHDFTFEVLNNNRLRLETEIQMLKHK